MSGPARLSNRFCWMHHKAVSQPVAFTVGESSTAGFDAEIRDPRPEASVPLNCVEKCKFTSQKPVKVEAIPRSAEVYCSENAGKRESGFEFIATDRLLRPGFSVSRSACKSHKIR